MKVLHAISSLNLSSGGPSLSTWSLVNGLRNLGNTIEIVTYRSKNASQKSIGNGKFVHTLSPAIIPRFSYSPELVPFLKSNPFEIYHGHGLWEYPTHAISAFARDMGRPYVISPRGMLYPEALNKSHLFKKFALPLYQRKDLECATVIHATCYQELEHIRNLGFRNPIAVIPNSIDVKIPLRAPLLNKIKRQVGFVGRFAPIKNLEMLIQTWGQSGKDEDGWELILIGSGDPRYTNELMQLVNHLRIQNIHFAGFLTGEEKEKALKLLDYLVLPSKSENFGMVVPEALIREIPVIASKGTPWEDLEIYKAGWWVDNDVSSLANTLKFAIRQSENAHKAMGRNGRRLVEHKYSIEIVAEQMIALYQYILEQSEKPDFVYE